MDIEFLVSRFVHINAEWRLAWARVWYDAESGL
jgi:hypothetical protein